MNFFITPGPGLTIFSVWLDLIIYVPVNSYGYVGTVSSPNHAFFKDKVT